MLTPRALSKAIVAVFVVFFLGSRATGLAVMSDVESVGPCSTACSSVQCLAAACTSAAPFLCTSQTSARGQCSSTPWGTSAACTSCCDYTSCFTTCATPCTIAECPPCYSAASTQTVCTLGPAAGQCSASALVWSPATGCVGCCNAAPCAAIPTPPPTPLTNPPVLTPVPGWTPSPTDFPPPTPLPPGPAVTPIPSGRCPVCSVDQCLSTAKCMAASPFLCLTGTAANGCLNAPWTSTACTSCCDFTACLPPPPQPYPPSPWDMVPPSQNCTNNASLAFAPNPAATPYGGMDVSGIGCRAGVTEDCCGVTPRYNWAIAMCHQNASLRSSMACNHTNGNTSAAEVYYVRAYQFDLATGGWVLDPASSFTADQPGDLLNFTALNLSLLDAGDHQDWDMKFGPTTAQTNTNGLGPPGMLFLLSARRLQWITFYALNQIIMNRGPGGERYADNCWSSSAGEFDFLEAPFWGGISLPADRLYTTITSGTGRCLPVQKMVSRQFQRECSDGSCCQACACPLGYVCAGNPRLVGFEPMSCFPPNATIPPDLHVFAVNGDDTACGAYFGAVPGGAQSTSFFSNASYSGGGAAGDSNSEIIIAAVVDGDGVTVMRWHALDDSAASAVWSGVGKYTAADTLPPTPTISAPVQPPCTDPSSLCALHVPSCTDDCALLSAGGTFGDAELGGAYAAECARDNLNWWNYFVSTQQVPSMTASQLAMFVDVPAVPVHLPFTCNHTCPISVCQSSSRCSAASPYMCLSGDAYLQCSGVPSEWPLSGHCLSCCDVTTCEVPCAATCSPTVCITVDCDTSIQPYFCESGPLQSSCSASAGYFPQQYGCYSCCDASACSV